MGSIILHNKEGFVLRSSVLINGQQRITTIYLLLKALFDSIDNKDTKELLQDALCNRFKGEPENRNETNKLRLKASSKDNDDLMWLINGMEHSIKKDSGIYRNYQFFKENIKKIEIEEGIPPKSIFNALKRLTVVVIILDKDDVPQVVFECINSTGLPLELFDLIRNYVLMIDSNQEE